MIAHHCIGAPGMAPEKRALDAHIQAEIAEAKRIKAQLGCSWTEALRLARKQNED